MCAKEPDGVGTDVFKRRNLNPCATQGIKAHQCRAHGAGIKRSLTLEPCQCRYALHSCPPPGDDGRIQLDDIQHACGCPFIQEKRQDRRAIPIAHVLS